MTRNTIMCMKKSTIKVKEDQLDLRATKKLHTEEGKYNNEETKKK